ncbi:MAG: anti-sigma factor family protein [Candidatus Binataceae bacterium]
MTCREFIEFLGAYHDNELPQGQRAVFETHLAQCLKCRDYLRSYRATIRLAKRAMDNPDGRPPDSVPEELVKAIMAARKG